MAPPSHVDAAERCYERVHDLRNADDDYPPFVRAIQHERKAIAAMTPDEYYAYAVRISRRFGVPLEAFDQAVLARATLARGPARLLPEEQVAALGQRVELMAIRAGGRFAVMNRGTGIYEKAAGEWFDRKTNKPLKDAFTNATSMIIVGPDVTVRQANRMLDGYGVPKSFQGRNETSGPARPARPALFTLESCTEEVGNWDAPLIRFKGYSTGDYWNGFSRPNLTREAADLLMKSINAVTDWEESREPSGGDQGMRITYDTKTDTFVGLDPVCPEEPYLWRGEDLETVDGKVRVYGIGAGSWSLGRGGRRQRSLRLLGGRHRLRGDGPPGEHPLPLLRDRRLWSPAQPGGAPPPVREGGRLTPLVGLRDPQERFLTAQMGGAIAELLRRAYQRPFESACGHSSLDCEWVGYAPHEAGLPDADGKRWWCFMRCSVCGSDSSFQKVHRRFDGREIPGVPA